MPKHIDADWLSELEKEAEAVDLIPLVDNPFTDRDYIVQFRHSAPTLSSCLRLRYLPGTKLIDEAVFASIAERFNQDLKPNPEHSSELIKWAGDIMAFVNRELVPNFIELSLITDKGDILAIFQDFLPGYDRHRLLYRLMNGAL